MILKLPTSFSIQYPEKNSLYYKGKDKTIIVKLLMEACDGYCMYCGKNMRVDNKEEFNIEHSLEKSMNIEGCNFLENCKFNLSLACPSCNQKYKTKMIETVPKKFLNYNIECNEKICKEPCKEYIAILEEYIKLNNIILQPNIIDNNLKSYNINYNLLKHTFEPGIENNVEYNFISNHIARFHLNRERYTKAILNISENLYNKINILGEDICIKQLFAITRQERYENILEKKFFEFLEDTFENTKSLKEYCELTLILSYL